MTSGVLHRSGDRFVSRSPGVETWHSLSFGPHYDPGNTAFGRLVLHDEHRLEPGAGFAPHPHAGVEVVSWVLEGVLVHEDRVGGRRELGPGTLQHLSAGSGVVHAERAGEEQTRFVQAWLLADEPAAAPSYACRQPEAGRPLPVLQLGSAVLHAGRLPAGEALTLPPGGLVHAFVASGQVRTADALLEPGDALRQPGQGPVELRAERDSDLLVWEMQVTRLQE